MRLLDYGIYTDNINAEPIVLIPSLINRYYILDLEESCSMVRYLAEQGYYPYILDWDIPDSSLTHFTLADYVQRIVLPALEFVYNTSLKPVHMLGYCMGGVLALAASQLMPDAVKSLLLLATPWDFHSDGVHHIALSPEHTKTLNEWLDTHEQLPAEILQHLFYLHDPWLFADKFRRFRSLNTQTRAYHEFLAVEHWVNDGVPLAREVARECLLKWTQQNILATGKWCVGGEVISPKKTSVPSFCAIPENDKIVPPGSAESLTYELRYKTIVQPTSGHVGMVVGRNAKQQLWKPMVEWLRTIENN